MRNDNFNLERDSYNLLCTEKCQLELRATERHEGQGPHHTSENRYVMRWLFSRRQQRTMINVRNQAFRDLLLANFFLFPHFFSNCAQSSK